MDRNLPRLDKTKIQVTCQKVSSFVNLERDRKLGKFKEKELGLAKAMKQKYPDHTDVVLQTRDALKYLNMVYASNLILKDLELIKTRAMVIESCVNKRDFEQLAPLFPYIEDVIFAKNFLNISAISEFDGMIKKYFGPNIYSQITDFTRVNNDLKGYSKPANHNQLIDYMEQVKKRHKIDIDLESLITSKQEEADPEEPINIGIGEIDFDINEYMNIIEKIKAIGV